MENLNNKKGTFQIHTYFLMLYFCIAPLEDLLTGSFGTVAKYVALIIVFLGLAKIKNWNLSLGVANLCIIWLMLLSVMSCLWAINYETAVGRISAYITVPGICLFVSMLDFSEKEYKAIVNSAIIGGVLASIYVIVTNGSELLESGRITLNENNDPNNFAALLLLPLALSIGKVIATTSKKLKLWYIAGVVIISFIFLMTGSRGGLLGLAVFFAAYIAFTKAYQRLSVMLSMMLILVVVGLVVLPMLPEDIFNRLFDRENFSGTGSGRTVIWKAFFTKVLPDNLLIGVGAGCVPEALKAYLGNVTAVHNAYFNMLGEYGILGLPVFLIMLYDRWHTQYVKKQYIEAALLVGICAIIFFLDSYAKKFFWNIIMLIIINEKVRENSDKEKSGYN